MMSFKAKGLVAQLNSAPDYGSGGSRFESWQGHIANPQHPYNKVVADFFMILYRPMCGHKQIQ